MAMWNQHGDVGPTWRRRLNMATSTEPIVIAKWSPCLLYVASPCWAHVTMLTPHCHVGSSYHVESTLPCSANVVMLGIGYYHVWSTPPCWPHMAMLGPRYHVGSLSTCRGARTNVGTHKCHNFIAFSASVSCGLPTFRRKLERALAPLGGVSDPKCPISK